MSGSAGQERDVSDRCTENKSWNAKRTLSPMVCLLPSAGRLVREAGMLRRRYCSGPLVLLGVAVCLFYQTLMVARNRLRSNQPAADVRNKKPFDELLLADTGRFISALETLQREREVQESAQKAAGRRRAVVLTGRHTVTDTEVQLYQRVLEQVGYEVQLSRYAETSGVLRPSRGSIEWSILVCLSGSEKSCLRRVSFSHLQPHQRVNMVPWLVQAFSDAGGGLCQFDTNTRLSGFALPMKPYACGSTNEKLRVLQDSTRHERDPDRYSASPPKPPGLIAVVNVYVLVASASPLTAFLHERCVVRTNEELSGQTTQLKSFLLQRLGPTASHKALGQLKEVIGQVLRAAVLTNQEVNSLHRCLLCYQLLTFTLHFTGSLTPVVVKLDTDLRFAGLRDPAFDGQITKELILEDTLRFLLPPHSGLPGLKMTSHVQRDGTEKYGGCKGTHGLCLPEDELLLLLQFHRQMKTPGAFELLFPSASLEDQPVEQLLSQSVTTANSAASVFHLPALLLRLGLYHQLQRNHTFRADEAETQSNQESILASQDLLEGRERCVDPHLRQIYTDPPLTLTPTFSPWVKEYHAEVPFDVVTVRIRPEPVSSACRIHLDEHRGPRTANYPVGLGNSRISILVADETVPEPVVMTIYTLHMYRESRPSLPMFGDHVMCGFVQDCGLIVQPGQPCGLQPFPGPKTSSTVTPQPCTSGDVPGQWVVPCLSCADNRTCDWREVAWQPQGCYHPVLDHPQLQDCMTDRKVLFIGDSTNRGMMYFLMERVNTSLEDWGKAHDTLIYSNLNRGRTHVSYSYYPQFWLEKSLRPTFQQALEQLIHRSRPLVNSNQTVLVAGGVQWLNTNHLRVIKEVLEREGLSSILVVVKSLGMGFHLPVDGIRSLSLRGIQELYRENHKVVATAKQYGYEVIDTFCITMGRYKEFLQGRCACHFHEVEKLWFSKAPLHRKMKILQHNADDTTSGSSRGGVTGTGAGPGLSGQSVLQDADQWTASNASSYHVRGPVNQVYSEILLSRLCPRNRGN